MLGWMDGYKCNFWPLSIKFAKQIYLQSGFCYKNFCHSLGRKATEYAFLSQIHGLCEQNACDFMCTCLHFRCNRFRLRIIEFQCCQNNQIQMKLKCNALQLKYIKQLMHLKNQFHTKDRIKSQSN